MRRTRKRIFSALLAACLLGFGISSFWLLSRPRANPKTAPVALAKPTVDARPKPTLKPPAKPKKPRRVVDSRMTRAQALGSNSFPQEILAKMEVVEVEYLGFDGLDHTGQIVVERSLAAEVRQIFKELKRARYPIKKVVPVVRYQWDDLKSMADNNTSGFNYRGQVTSNGQLKVLSKHAYGRAIDLNPYLNPYVSRKGKSTSPYDPQKRGTLTRHSPATKIFLARGWKWGGNWEGAKDYQHFVK